MAWGAHNRTIHVFNWVIRQEGGSMEISSIQARLQAFSAERNWEQYHSPKNLAMALAVEAAELMEIFQWVGAEESRNIVNHPDKMEQVGAELADVCVYAIRLADVTGIDLEAAIHRKIDRNAEKHPSDANRHWSM